MFLLLLSIPIVQKKCKSISLKLNGLFSKTQLKSICLAGNVFDRKSTPCAIQLAYYMSSRIPLKIRAKAIKALFAAVGGNANPRGEERNHFQKVTLKPFCRDKSIPII